MFRLPDVSSLQGKVDWKKVASLPDVKGAVLRCYVGNDYGDSQFANNVKAAEDAGLRVGAYFFGYPLLHLKPEDQAKSHAKLNKGDLPPSFDLEWPAPEKWGQWHLNTSFIQDWALKYLEVLASETGRTPLVYTYPYFWKSLLKTSPDFAKYPLWMADYGKYQGKIPPEGSSPVVPEPWNTWTLWQHDGTGGLGLPGGSDCDWNVFNGDEAAWEALLNLPLASVAHEVGSNPESSEGLDSRIQPQA